jgi:hypothetical protein
MNSAVVVASQPRNLAPASEPRATAQSAKPDAMAKATAEVSPESKSVAKPKIAQKTSKPRKRVVRQRDDYGPNFAWTWQEERRPWGWNDRQYYRGRF